MVTDTELLRSYAHDRSESAFSELVHRHIDMVYSAALRETRGNASLAEDITQSVFAELARKASKLERHPALASRYNVQGIPHFVVLRGGRVVSQHSGFVRHDQMEAWLRNAQSVASP